MRSEPPTDRALLADPRVPLARLPATSAIVELIPGLDPDEEKETVMQNRPMQNRPQQLLVASAVCAALALGSSAVAAAATDRSGPASTTIDHARESWIGEQSLTDHEQYLRHHQRLASA